MCANWNTSEGYDRNLPQLLAERFESIRTDGGFEGFEYQEYVTVLQSIVTFRASIPDAVKRGLVYGSLFAAAQSGKITANSIVREISKLEGEYESRTSKRLVLATSLSVRYLESLKRAEISGCRMTFGRYLPESFRQSRLTLMDEVSLLVLGKLPNKYLTVRISVQARSEHEAFESALNAMDLLRGIWNLFFNLRKPFRSSLGKRKPVNKILLGPIHTLHEPDGELAYDTALWYEEDYVGPISCQRLDKDWDSLRKFERKARDRLSKHSYREDIEDSIRRYTRALDSRDWNTSFVRLWSLLEKLTSTLAHDSHKTTVRRALFLQRDRHYHGQVLNHLRDNRNKAVHAGQEAAEIETLLYQTKRYTEALLRFHIFNIYGFSSIQDAAEFLDLPPDVPDLREKILSLEKRRKLMKNAIRFDSYSGKVSLR